jgi:hypothetical protein
MKKFDEWRTAMDSPDQVQKTGTKWMPVVGWGVFAAVAGLGCLVLPPHLIPGGIVNPSYGHPLIPWFASAFANFSFVLTLTLLFVLGAVLGLAQPRWWPLSCCLTVSLPMVLNDINIRHDWTIDPTSHNLFPFEFAILMFFALPALAAGMLVSLVRRAIERSRSKSCT